MEAAEHWAGGRTIDERTSDAAALGIELSDTPLAISNEFEVWPENWPVVEMFLRVQTQWRTTMSGVVGMDYAALAWVFRLYEIDKPQALLEDLQIMEAAVMGVINKQET